MSPPTRVLRHYFNMAGFCSNSLFPNCGNTDQFCVDRVPFYNSCKHSSCHHTLPELSAAFRIPRVRLLVSACARGLSNVWL